jgi:hypothetical protein
MLGVVFRRCTKGASGKALDLDDEPNESSTMINIPNGAASAANEMEFIDASDEASYLLTSDTIRSAWSDANPRISPPMACPGGRHVCL